MENTEQLLKRIDRVKIVCKEGVLQNTHIYTQDGQELRVTKLNLYLVDNVWMADITLFRAELDLSDVLIGYKYIKCPKCKEVEELSS